MGNIKKIQKVSVGDEVFKQLKQMLIEGTWKPGDKLPSENTLAEMLGVSRITVRQVLHKLNAMGLIETRVGEGSFVRSLNVGESMQALIPTLYLNGAAARDVFEFRELIDVEAARCAARRATTEDIAELQRVMDQMLQYQDREDLTGFAELDTEFHYLVAKASGNSLMLKTETILRDVIQETMKEIINRMGMESALVYHQAIIKAIQEKDEEKAAATMMRHLKNNRNHFVLET